MTAGKMGEDEPYRLLFERNPHPMWVYDLETLAFLAVNDTAIRHYGYSREEFLGMTIADIRPPEDVPALLANVRRVTEGLDNAGVWRHRKKDGTVIEVDIVSHTLTFAGRRAELVLAQDVTAQRKATRALEESEARFRMLFDLESDAIVMIENRTGRILEANAAASAMYGFSRDELLGLRNSDLSAEPEETRRVSTATPIDPEQVVRIPLRHHRRKDGTVFPVEISGRFFGWQGQPVHIAAIRDITLRKQAEAALREANQRFQAIIDASPAGIVVLDRDGLVRLWSRAAERLLGWSEAEVLGKPSPSVPAGQAAEHQATLEQTRRGEAISGLELRRQRKDGSPVDLSLWTTPLWGPDGAVSGVVGIMADITDRKRAEAERRKFEDGMRHVQKLESLGVLAGGIAHDFNNLLMAILGNADLALLGLPPAAPARQNLEEIGTAARRAADLCRQMLAYSGRGRFTVEKLDLPTIVREMTQLLEVSVSKKAVVQYRFAEKLPPVEADATQLRQVIMNLIINASEALGDRSGSIIIGAGMRVCDRADLAEGPLGADLPEGPYVCLEVSDTGCGMDAATRERIFDPFFTTKFTGRGLGLAAVLGIVRAHRGTIKVSSEPGKGTSITVLLPAAAETAAGSPGLSTAEQHAWAGGGTVLLVDDEARVREVTQDMLESLGFQVMTAADGVEALEAFRKHADAIACVILDLTMPRVSGEEVLQELRRLRDDLRVILSSGYTEQEVIGRFVGKGLAGFIQKPYTIAALRQVLQRVLG